MKIIVTHASPDWDAITSVWLLKKFLPGWQEADVCFVPAGQRLPEMPPMDNKEQNPVEKRGDDEIIHVDTGLGALDHHQTADQNVCAASKTWDFVQKELTKAENKLTSEHKEAISRVVKVVVGIDHFKEVFWGDPMADYHEFSLLGLLEGVKILKPDQDSFYVEFGSFCLEALAHNFENRIWAEREIKEKGIVFKTEKGVEGIAFETLNDTVLKLAQKMGYLLVVRRDPRKGYVRIKLRPASSQKDDLDLSRLYEELQRYDPAATWFLHVSKKMLLNGTPKNPQMKPTKLSLREIIDVIKKIY